MSNKVTEFKSSNTGFKTQAQAPSTISMSKIVFAILGIVLLCLLVVSFVRYANGSSNVSFEGFLEYVSNIPSFRITINITDYTIKESWVVFDGFRQFLNVFGTLFGVILFLCSSLYNMLVYVCYFLAYIFA